MSSFNTRPMSNFTTNNLNMVIISQSISSATEEWKTEYDGYCTICLEDLTSRAREMPCKHSSESKAKAMDDPPQAGILAPVAKESKDCTNKCLDSILSHMVSLLRIKHAVETSVLSRQWRYLWKTRPNLEFDIPNIFGDNYTRLVEKYGDETSAPVIVDRFDRQCFVRRVSNLLELYSGNRIQSLRVAFFFDVESTEIFDKCVHFAIANGAQVLDLQLFSTLCFNDEAEFYVFPHRILLELDNASNLKHLSLERCVLKLPTDFNRLAQLKTLRLNNVVADSGFLEHLSSVCVLLEGLTLRKCRVHSNLIIIGPSLHLKDLKVLDCNTLDKIEIDAVNLSSFEFQGIILKISCMTTPLLVRFFFRGCCDLYGLPYAFTLLALCPGLETLQLLLLNRLENIPQTVPTFGNLKHLNLDLFTPNFDLWSVLNILKAAPNLEEPIITI
ncbi:hypothetical protein ACLB2K_058061 [Fragaria x ananassa]